jgi:hypothetical protein
MPSAFERVIALETLRSRRRLETMDTGQGLVVLRTLYLHFA